MCYNEFRSYNVEVFFMNEKQNKPCSGDGAENRFLSRKNTIIIISIIALSVILIFVCASVIACSPEEEEAEGFPPIDPALLEDTKEEDFDILEYDEYLSLNRSIMLEDKRTGASLSIDDTSYRNYGEAVELVYKMLNMLIEGDHKAYNSIVSEEAGRFEWFSQQQIYDVTMYEKSREEIEGKNGSYTEYVIVLKYKIHENNGSYRNNIISDSARPQYIVINDSTGRLLIMDIIDTRS